MFTGLLTDDINIHIDIMVRGNNSYVNYYLQRVMKEILRLILTLARILQLKVEIYNFRKLYSEPLYEARFRFKKNLLMVPNHRITG